MHDIVNAGDVMKMKKFTIIISGGIAIINLLLFAILQFRLYHFFGVVGDGSLANLRDFLMIASSGLFTSACVTFIISIREYFDTSWAALRDLKRLVNNISKKLKSVAWYDPQIPSDILINYFQLKYRSSLTFWEELLEHYKRIGKNPPTEVLDAIKKEEKIKKAFREQAWKNTPLRMRPLFYNEREKECFLDERVPLYEKEIEESIKLFFESLQIFKHYDYFQIQSAIDSMDFFFFKKRKIILQSILQQELIVYLAAIDDELQKQSLKPNDNMQRIYSLVLLNKLLLRSIEDESKVCCYAEFKVAIAQKYIDYILFHDKEVKLPELGDFDIRYSYRSTAIDDIIADILHN